MPEDATPQTEIGRRVLHYRITQRLGAGGMGVVCKALDEKLERSVALKFLPPFVGADDTLKRRLLQEAKAASSLDHPNVGTIYGIEQTPDGEIFIVMACYEGETLAERIRRGPVPANVALSYAIQILEGLAAAHAKGVVHRDIKPSNIFVTVEGVVKILDFGLAKMTGAVTLTEAGSTVGTAAYMSPEQAQGKEALYQSDLWSVGVVLYEMLSGKLPFSGQNHLAMLLKIVQEAPEPMDAAVPPEVQRLLSRALAKDLADRYPSASEMVHDLEAAVSGVPMDSKTRTMRWDAAVSSGTRSGRAPSIRPRRARTWILVGAVAGVAAVAAIAGPRLARVLLPAKWFEPPVRRLAVLPFRNIGNDPANAALCDGLEEILTSRLASAQNPRNPVLVIPAGEVRRRNVGNAADAHTQLGATLVVDGTLMRSGHGLEMTLNLVDAVTLTTVNSAILKDPAGDFATLEDAAIQRVADLLSVRAGPSETARATTIPAAYESYVKATGYLSRYDKPANLDSAISEFEKAIQTDPRFALAYAGLGEASRLKYRINKDPKWLKTALGNAKLAIQLNDQLAPAYITLGRLHDGSGETQLAIQELDTSLKLDPRNAEANLAMASAYEHAGRLKEAEALYKKSIDLRPEYWGAYSQFALFYTREGRYPEAEAQYRIAIRYAPDNAILIGNFGVLLDNEQKRNEARAMYQKSISLSPSYSSYSNLGTLEFEDGHYPEAAGLFEKALKLNDRDYHVWNNLAVAYEHSSGWDAKARSTLEHAAELAEKVREERPRDAGVLADLATYFAKLGRKDLALERLRQARALAPDDVDVLFWTSEAYEEMGRRDDALAGFQEAFQKGLTADRVTHDPELNKLSADPRYLAMVRNLPKRPAK